MLPDGGSYDRPNGHLERYGYRTSLRCSRNRWQRICRMDRRSGIQAVFPSRHPGGPHARLGLSPVSPITLVFVLIDDVRWFPMTHLSLVESANTANTSNSLAFRDAYPEVRILKDFKSSEFGSADCKGVSGLWTPSWLDCGVGFRGKATYVANNGKYKLVGTHFRQRFHEIHAWVRSSARQPPRDYLLQQIIHLVVPELI
jgi:hypothetical protein